MIRVVLADDHKFLRTGIRNIIIQKTKDIVVIGEAENGFDALQLVHDLEPDVLVLDIEMPDLTGYDVTKQLRAESAASPVLALSTYEDKQYILSMLGFGAYGYLTKDEVPSMIVRAIRGVARKERGWVSRRVAARLAVWLQGENSDQVDLTDGDFNLLRMFLAGKTNEQIGKILGMNQQSVEKRLERSVMVVRKSLDHLL
jgi:two-component system invasion response regulator UvrY